MSEGKKGIKNFFEPDDVFADYTILKFCGRGAYGEVYLAEDITRKTIALKVIPILTGSEIWRMELIGLRHYRQCIDDYRSLIEIYHVGETEEFFYYTMEPADNLLHDEDDEYLADTLAHRLARGGRMAPDKVLELAFSLLDALDNLSEHDLAHRDLKPANIVFVNGKAKLSDLGLISNTGVCSKLVGTVDFLPPELADGDPVGYSNDLYALGKVLYCALTGLLPERFPEIPVTVPLTVWRQFRPIILRACSEDPRQRFYTSEEFRKALPSAIRDVNFFDQAFEELRFRYKQHPLLWRMCFTSAALLVLGAILGGYLHWSQLRALKLTQQSRIDFIFRTIDDLRNQLAHLERLSESSGRQALCRQLEIVAEQAVNERAAGNWDATERYCLFADKALRSWAEENARELLEKCPEKLEDLTAAQQEELLRSCNDFTETPLFQYLGVGSKAKFNRILANLKKLWNPKGIFPMPGEPWRFDDDENLDFVYVAQGRLADEPQQSYWIGANEVTVGSFRRMLGVAAGRSEANLPAVGLSWNERLLFCELLNRRAAEKGTLPAGMIYRLPTLQEWNFAFRGGWRSRGVPDYEQRSLGDIAWFGANSDYQLHPVRTRQPGMLGLYDMAGNAAETVLDNGSVVVCGASFRDRRIIPNLRQPCAMDEVESRQIGFRIVLGPGNREDLARLWDKGHPITGQTQRTAYELLGGARTRWQGKLAAEWCKLLGGRGAVFHGEAELREIFQEDRRWRNSAILLGARKLDTGWWQWADGTPMTEGIWIQHPVNVQEDEIYLVGDHGFWRSVNDSETVPWMMVEWPLDAFRKHETERANGTLAIPASPLIRKRFVRNGKEYFLISAPVNFCTAQRLAKLLGTRLAIPGSDADTQALASDLADHQEERIALGGCRFFDRWQWLDGHPAPDSLPVAGEAQTASLANHVPVFYNGKLCCADEFDSILCERPLRKP